MHPKDRRAYRRKKTEVSQVFCFNSPSGTVFIKPVDTSFVCKNAQNMFDLIDSIVEEIGKQNLLQVVIDGASALVKAGEILMEKR